LYKLLFRSEPFWIIVDNDSEILHSEYFILHKKEALKKRAHFKKDDHHAITFFIPYEVKPGESRVSASSNYQITVMSDRWYDVHAWRELNLSEIAIPDEDYPHTKLLGLRPLHISALKNE